MVERITHINPYMLKWAREDAGFEINEALVKIHKNVREWEEGIEYPTYAQLKKLSDMYRKPVAVFFFPEPPKIKNIPSSCRTLPEDIHNNFSPTLIKLLNDAKVNQLNLYELHGGINPSSLKITDIKFNSNDYKTIAKELRKILMIDLNEQKRIKKLTDAFEFWRDYFYQLGIYVFKDSFNETNISGFCLYDEEFPLIHINNNFTAARQIFTLFHELYHLISQTTGIDFMNDEFLNKYTNKSNQTIEKSCNKFASEFLVPDDDFNRLTKAININDDSIASLASTYGVSREVILRKFLDKNIISLQFYKEKRVEYNSEYIRYKKQKKDENNGGNYYNIQSVYKGRRYLELTFGKYYATNINLFQLSQYLNMKVPTIKALAAYKGWGEV